MQRISALHYHVCSDRQISTTSRNPAEHNASSLFHIIGQLLQGLACNISRGHI